MLAMVTVVVLAPYGTMAANCPPDGDDSLWPTFDTADQCGSYQKCTALERNNQLEEAKACVRTMDDCGVALNKSNEKAAVHNSALEACRAAIPNQQKAPTPKPSTDNAAPRTRSP
ncbi:MAG: hypothetical protein WB662_17840 [Methyloceanibacter sp.]|jgi:hypothetical protein